MAKKIKEEVLDAKADNELNLEDNKEFSLEESFTRLEEIIGSLEEGKISLDDSFKLYKEGVGLVKDCNSKLDKVEKEIIIINEDGEIEETDGEF
ncbi:exodeoxyribonuclease VII small subunit [Lachnospira pectinoschiza]|uniref:Exodeoxyribonuclease 7 small subunit n=1 Tax=Lachnospira pectinoschiza TaxID=28052 RepID=A0A1G9VNH7_9FIRM|nr:exodeoxyribonuclease VII small subunit [Lachnospira pectinoschiza]SDM73571.1 Exodeoxyribonuclease VII small subunit [Lachnospira pectinoschiza]